MNVHEIVVRTVDGDEQKIGEYAGKTLLIVNVASKCGLTPQYGGLQRLYDEYQARGLEILAFPCNQFGGQEPGSNDEIKAFCSLNYGVSFPLFDKVEVNGANRHPLYASMTNQPDAEGKAGDIAWNFEKFVVSPSGEVVARFRPPVAPDAPELLEALASQLPA